jgi:hypothetical protein
MGVSWTVMKPKADCPLEKLAHLIREQALAFQFSPSHWYRGWKMSPHWMGLMSVNSGQAFGDAIGQLRECLTFPEWDEQGNVHGIAGLQISRRVYGIANNPLFPPLWQLQANRTFLCEEIAEQAKFWRTWIDEIRAGKHQPYVIDLMLLELTEVLVYHWEEQHDSATATFEVENWAQNEECIAIRDQILRFPRPTVHGQDYLNRIPLTPPNISGKKYETELRERLDLLQKFSETARRLMGLARDWNRSVKKRWRVQWSCREELLFSPEQWIEQHSHGLGEMFAWFDQCVHHGFGFFLDH